MKNKGTSMLDDNDYIRRIDPEDGLSVAAQQPAQLDLEVAAALDAAEKEISGVVVAGMGGSALAAGMCHNWLNDQLGVALEVVRDYQLPAYVDETTLVICSSYSGNTEETVACFADARDRGANLIVVASGGRLEELAEESNIPFVRIPEGYQPRMAVWFGLKALATIFERLNLAKDIVAELNDAQGLLYSAAEEFSVEQPTSDNRAKQIAEALMGKAIWVYAGPALSSAAYKWKIDLNENAKNVASWNVLPELNHNEFIGWTSHPVEKPFSVVELTSNLDHPQVQRRFEVTNRLLSGKMPAPIEVAAKGQTRIEQILFTCLLGDFVSIYLGILNGVNPVRVDAIEKLKKEL